MFCSLARKETICNSRCGFEFTHVCSTFLWKPFTAFVLDTSWHYIRTNGPTLAKGHSVESCPLLYTVDSNFYWLWNKNSTEQIWDYNLMSLEKLYQSCISLIGPFIYKHDLIILFICVILDEWGSEDPGDAARWSPTWNTHSGENKMKYINLFIRLGSILIEEKRWILLAVLRCRARCIIYSEIFIISYWVGLPPTSTLANGLTACPIYHWHFPFFTLNSYRQLFPFNGI